MISLKSLRMLVGARTAAILFLIHLAGLGAGAQALSVLPVNIFLQPGQKATTLTVTNQGTGSTAIQIRAYVWSQKAGEDELAASDQIVVSPPIATIAGGATQVVRLILRDSPQGQESTYRILVDQIPPPTEPGVVHIVLRLSIPVFVMPAVRPLAHVQFHVERKSGKLFLVGVNDGTAHDVIRDIVLTTGDGQKLMGAKDSSPYILAGATRYWPIALEDSKPLPTDDSFQLSVHSNGGPIAQQVSVVTEP
jgi:fimbrial chaperone protein